jgi:hypothetical protein
MGEWSESHSLIPYALFPDPAGYASQPHSRSFTALEEVLGVQILPSAAKSPIHVASLTAWLKPCPCYRDARLRVFCFPRSQGRDLRPTHQDLFVGAPDLGTPFYRRVKESKCGFLGSRWSLGMRTFVYLGGRVRESNCRFLGSRWSLGMTTFLLLVARNDNFFIRVGGTCGWQGRRRWLVASPGRRSCRWR